MSEQGFRLKEERLRLGFSQTKLGELCGVKISAQQRYEKGIRKPDASYLMSAHRIGIDVEYVVTGVRKSEQNQIKEAENRKYVVSYTDEVELTTMITCVGKAIQSAGKSIDNAVLVGKIVPVYIKLTGEQPYNSRDALGKRHFNEMLKLIANQ